MKKKQRLEKRRKYVRPINKGLEVHFGCIFSSLDGRKYFQDFATNKWYYDNHGKWISIGTKKLPRVLIMD